ERWRPYSGARPRGSGAAARRACWSASYSPTSASCYQMKWSSTRSYPTRSGSWWSSSTARWRSSSRREGTAPAAARRAQDQSLACADLSARWVLKEAARYVSAFADERARACATRTGWHVRVTPTLRGSEQTVGDETRGHEAR